MRWIMLLLVALAGCSKGPEADLPSIGEARSLGAEWALVNELVGKGKVTTVYAEAMRKQLRQQLETDQQSLTQPDSSYGVEIRALLEEPDHAPPEELRAHATRLKKIEDGLESA